MTDREIISTSKFLSLILRHKPEKVGISLDANGWVDVDVLIGAMNKHGRITVTLDDIKDVVITNDKQRFAFNDDYTKIRANQGHSVSVDVELEEVQPPSVLYHGTSSNSIEGIIAKGIMPGQRLHVHLSGDEETALKVGQRHGKPVALVIHAAEMHKDGHKFFKSANGVWLTAFVPVEYIHIAPY